MSHRIRQALPYAEALRREMQREITDLGPTPRPTPYPVYGRELQREMTDLGPTPVPTTRAVYGMERIPVFPRRQVTGGLRLPTVSYSKGKQVAKVEEVFDDEFYDLFPWASGVDPFDESRTEWEPAEWYVENGIELGNGLPPDPTAEVPPAIAFIEGLISLELDELKQEDRMCAICLQPYRQGESQEIPLQLPCGHIFGKECLLTWLTDIGKDDAHVASCPMCRKECISEKRKHIGTHEGLRQLLRDANYVLTGMRGLSLTRDGREDWEDVMDYVTNYLTEIDDQKRERLRLFMKNLREGLRDFPVTVEPATVNAIGRDVVELRQTTSQLLDELEQRGIIEAYLDMLDADTDEAEVDETLDRLAVIIPGPLLSFMDEVYAEQYNIVSDDEVLPEDDADGDERPYNGGMSAHFADDGRILNPAALLDRLPISDPGRDDSIFTRERRSYQADPSASRPRHHNWIDPYETQQWTWQGGEDSDMENTQLNSDNDSLPDSDGERAIRLLGRRVTETYQAVMRNRPRRPRW